MDEEAPALLPAPSPERAGASPPAGGRNELVPSPKRLLLMLGCVAALLLGAHALTVQGKARKRTNGVNTNGVTAIFMFFDRRYFSVLPSNLCTSVFAVLF